MQYCALPEIDQKTTENQCPCPLQYLQTGKDTQFAANGNYAVFNSGTVSF